MKMGNLKWILGGFALLAFVMSPAYSQGDDCAGLLSTQAKVQNTTRQILAQTEREIADRIEFDSSQLVSQTRFPLQSKQRNGKPQSHIQFGFESEYTLNRWASRLLDHYGPDPKVTGIQREQWLTMKADGPEGEDGRVEWIKKNKKLLFPQERQPGGLIKITTDEALSFLPDRLILDSTGNLEIVMDPVDSFEQWYRQISLVNQKLGRGSMQGTLSVEIEDFFFKEGDPRESTDSLLGWFTFMAEFDSLLKLQKGYERYQAQPGKSAANSFKHPYVGPLNLIKWNRLRDLLALNAQGDGFDLDSMNQVAYRDDSFKYIGSTVYRPDIVRGKRIVLEARDAHSDFDVLVNRMIRGIDFLQSSREVYREAVSLKAYDSEKVFQRLPKRLQKFFAQLFPSRLKANALEIGYSQPEVTSHEVYRNFSYPLRDWSKHIAFLGDSGLEAAIQKAQKRYLQAVKQIQKEFKQKKISKIEASIRVQYELSRFVVESGLVRAFATWHLGTLQKLEDELAQAS